MVGTGFSRYRWLCRPFLASPLLMVLMSCGSNQPQNLAPLADEFVYTSLAYSPVNATAQGYHEHKGASLDTQLDDLSPRGFNEQRNFYAAFHRRLTALDRNKLSPEDRADFDIIEDQIALTQFDIDIAQTWRNNPTYYVELAGNAIFAPFVLEYAPLHDRMRHIIARLEKFPELTRQARFNLRRAPAIWIKVAKEENDGNIGLIDKDVREKVPADLKEQYDKAADNAITALKGFNQFLETELPRRGDADWRLGEDRYKIKFRFALGTDRTPADVHSAAVADLKIVRARMLDLATPLHKQWFAAHAAHDNMNVTIKEVLDHIADKHSTPATYVADAKANLDEATKFVRAKNLLTLPARENLQVIETPEFMRGIYSVGGFNPAPVLQPQLGAFYWLTPIPSDWKPERINSKLREYNFYNLKLLTLHEAMPGHYVQSEFANDIQPKTRRVLRALYGNGPYIEGWAQYATQAMLDEGYLDHSPELRLTLDKQELRVLANAIIDIQVQTGKMTDQQALDLMEKDTFQEVEEATGKLQRVKLSSTQLPTYYIGWRGWIAVREEQKKRLGDKFNLHDFHDRALKEGALPLPVLGRILSQ
jgi:uncharacterized protein (DUF885 family)